MLCGSCPGRRTIVGVRSSASSSAKRHQDRTQTLAQQQRRCLPLGQLHQVARASAGAVARDRHQAGAWHRRGLHLPRSRSSWQGTNRSSSTTSTGSRTRSSSSSSNNISSGGRWHLGNSEGASLSPRLRMSCRIAWQSRHCPSSSCTSHRSSGSSGSSSSSRGGRVGTMSPAQQHARPRRDPMPCRRRPSGLSCRWH